MIQKKGWAKFNSWVKSIHNSPDLTEKQKEYIDKRITENVEKGEGEKYWNRKPINLISMWVWSNQDVKRGVRKASRLGF